MQESLPVSYDWQKQFPPARKIYFIILLQIRELFFFSLFTASDFLTQSGFSYIIESVHASVAELVDAQDLGSCALCIRVRVPSLAPKKLRNLLAPKLFILEISISSESHRFPVVGAFQDAAHGFVVHLPRIFRGAGVEDGVVGDGVLLFQVQFFRNAVIFKGQRNVHHAV